MNDLEKRRGLGPVEDALQTYPLSHVPASMKTCVMGRIRPAAIAPRFSFPWLETAISLIFTILGTAFLSLLLAVPPAAAMRLENAARIFFLQPDSRSILLAAASSAVLSCVCLVFTLSLFRKSSAPRLSSRH